MSERHRGRSRAVPDDPRTFGQFITKRRVDLGFPTQTALVKEWGGSSTSQTSAIERDEVLPGRSTLEKIKTHLGLAFADEDAFTPGASISMETVITSDRPTTTAEILANTRTLNTVQGYTVVVDERPLASIPQIHGAFAELREKAFSDTRKSLWAVSREIARQTPRRIRAEVHLAIADGLRSGDPGLQGMSFDLAIDLSTRIALSAATEYRSGERGHDDDLLLETFIGIARAVPNIYKDLKTAPQQRTARITGAARRSANAYHRRTEGLPKSIGESDKLWEFTTAVRNLYRKHPFGLLETAPETPGFVPTIKEAAAALAGELNLPKDKVLDYLQAKNDEIVVWRAETDMDLVQTVEDLTTPEEFELLEKRFGIGRDKPVSFDEIGEETGVSGTAVWLKQKDIIKKIQRDFDRLKARRRKP
jgi:hypothetical protein